ncbi:protein GPR107 [Metopolophium dirhodum]|uniref:protein GPR107 n=1 Tax=Metopolophium dirhodum TaxID=44670 RepID=UPI0029903AA0|nr:protein GPR107 [Metopolophium dirhodum]XP_060862332.1 protein GPR107 [Metopolophium dirhodum]
MSPVRPPAVFVLFALSAVLAVQVAARIHTLPIHNDDRRFIALTTFGFFRGGLLEVEIVDFYLPPDSLNETHGLLLEKSLFDEGNPYIDSQQEICPIESPNLLDIRKNSNLAVFKFNFPKKLVTINCSDSMEPFYLFENMDDFRKNLNDIEDDTKTSHINKTLPISNGTQPDSFNIKFVVYVKTRSNEGLYNLYYHNCPNYATIPKSKQSFTVTINEINADGNYLSAGDMPLPSLYFSMSIIYFFTDVLWVYFLYRSTYPVYKIHYLMALLVFLKAATLFFHGLNFHFIQVKGQHIATWAFVYYAIHLLKGSVLFITIVLIGTGMTFVKHVLSDKDKNIFMIVIPLQVLANVAYAIIQESEEGDMQHNAWLDLFLLVDFMCCAAILFPILWSIRHLQEASQTDGKAAINLRKLKLFQQFYVMLVSYIYFTRILIYMLRMTVPFHLLWLNEFSRETATFIFFAMTGYKFRPTIANPYFQVASDVDDDDTDIVISHFGSGVSNRSRKKANNGGETAEDEIMLVESSS